ncbi:glycosyltransferase family 4 protein [Oculatella sp. LEGE 06141]|uniref:glycosyltransferase n=1 Tax=Oculatella sp. LEGE 06141 TaxID=1828648 RepID=UPI001882A39A|nr:glycosyltransferase family 4 protein [Oculatella sp. LEGE 06141]
MKLNYRLKKTTWFGFDSIDAVTQPFVQTKRPIKLSVITQFFPPDFAATGQLLDELVRHLGEQGIDVKVFTGQPGYAFRATNAPIYEKKGLVQIKRSRTSQMWPQRIRGKAVNGLIFSVRAILHLLKNCRRRDLVLITTAPPFLPVLGYLAHLWFGMPYVCLLYDLYPDIAVELGVVPAQHWVARVWRNVNRLVWRNAEKIIVLSPAMKQRVISACPDVADKVSVIHSWADPERIVPIAKNKNWFAWKHNLVKKFTVLYSGNMGRCHDMDTILEAAKRLQDDPIEFVFIGGGAGRDVLIEEVQQFGLKNFQFLPYQDKEILPYSLTACDLSLVSVSPGMENLVAPSKLYSALSAGRPIAVICSKESYLNQIIKDADCGATFENGDGQRLAEFIRHLSVDQRLAENMGNAGRRYLQRHFTPTVIAKQYFGLINQAFANAWK